MSLIAPDCSKRPLEPAPGATASSLAISQLLLLMALAVAVVGQGAYYFGPQVLVGVLLAAAATMAWRDGIRPPRPVTLALAVLALWAGLSATFAGDAATALPTVALLGAIAAVVMVVQGATRRQREQLVTAVIGLGVLLAASGWVGVALRLSPLALSNGGLWRAATTLTYANAAAAVMAPLALLAMARLVDRASRPARAAPAPALGAGRADTLVARAAVFALVIGVAATGSRAGIVGLGLGCAVLAGFMGPRRAATALWRCLLGAGIASLALTLSMPASSPARPAWAVLGLLAGIVVAFAPLGKRLGAGLVVGVAVLGSLAVVFGGHHLPSLSAVWDGRVSVSSPDRGRETQAALILVRHHLLTGVGPGRAAFIWTSSHHQLVVDRYAHDEYLQLAAEEGVLGLAGLALLVTTIVRAVRAGWRDRQPRSVWAGAAAGLVGLAWHSGFDFLWHVPVVPLIAAVLVGLCSPALIPTYPPTKRRRQHEAQELG